MERVFDIVFRMLLDMTVCLIIRFVLEVGCGT